MTVKKNCGIYLRDDGHAFFNPECTEEINPYIDKAGYLFISDDDLLLSKPSSVIECITGDLIQGKYLHRMMVFSFNDRNGNEYREDSVIDHLDMNHKNNAIYNLEVISNERNLFRAYCKLPNKYTKEKFTEAFEKLTEGEKLILNMEIQQDFRKGILFKNGPKINFKLFFDMDDTLAEFTKEGMTDNSNLKLMYNENYFRNLKPTSFLGQVNEIAAIMPEDLYIISTCIDTPYCKNEKIEWLKENLPYASKENVIFVEERNANKAEKFKEKFGRYPTRYDILIDDYSANIDAWENAGGTAIKFINWFNNKSNKKYKYVIKDLKDMMSVLANIRHDLEE